VNDTESVVDVGWTEDQSSPEHPEHQRWVKQTLVEDTQKWMQTLPPSQQWTHPQIERKISEDVRLHYAKERDDVAHVPIAPPPVEHRGDDPAAEMAENLGYQFERKEATNDDASLGAFRRDSMACKFCGTCRNCSRIARVQMLVGIYRDSDGNVQAQFPGLVGELMRLFWQKSQGIGQFEGKSKRDVVRIFNRGIDDICDRSVPILGKWWT
jgi:hypothetical protein